MVGCGATLVTAMIVVAVPGAPCWSVAARLMASWPLSSGVKLKPAPLPVAYGAPSFVTLQAKVKSAGLALLGSLAAPVRAMAVPSGALAGAPPMVAVGATFATA